MEKKSPHESTQHTQLSKLPTASTEPEIFLPITGVRHTKSGDSLSLQQLR